MTNGTTPTDGPTAPPPFVQPTNGLAIAAMVLGIIALFTFWMPLLGWLPAVVGLVLGLVALQQPQGRGMAVAGVVCAGLSILFKLFFWLAIFHFLAHFHRRYWGM
jgi:hypothetical protein